MAANPAVHCKDQGSVAVEQPGDGSLSLAPGNLIKFTATGGRRAPKRRSCLSVAHSTETDKEMPNENHSYVPIASFGVGDRSGRNGSPEKHAAHQAGTTRQHVARCPLSGDSSGDG